MVQQQRGFTLIEVLVALVIMATMAVMSWRGIDALLRSRDIAQAHLDQTVRLQTVLGQWEQDLRALQDSRVVPPLSFDGASLRITRTQALGMQVVAWTLRSGRLYRWEGPIVQTAAALAESFQRSQQVLTQESVQLKTLEGLNGWQLFYYRGNGWSNALSSDDVQPGSVPAAPGQPPAGPARVILPTGVRMVLQFGPGSGFNGSLTRQIVMGPQS